jgi:hypothetical protein
MNYILQDNFNEVKISGHRTLRAAVAAQHRHAIRLNRNSPGAYIWYRITDASGAGIDGDLILEAEIAIQNRR